MSFDQIIFSFFFFLFFKLEMLLFYVFGGATVFIVWRDMCSAHMLAVIIFSVWLCFPQSSGGAENRSFCQRAAGFDAVTASV